MGLVGSAHRPQATVCPASANALTYGAVGEMIPAYPLFRAKDRNHGGVLRRTPIFHYTKLLRGISTRNGQAVGCCGPVDVCVESYALSPTLTKGPI